MDPPLVMSKGKLERIAFSLGQIRLVNLLSFGWFASILLPLRINLI